MKTTSREPGMVAHTYAESWSRRISSMKAVWTAKYKPVLSIDIVGSIHN